MGIMIISGIIVGVTVGFYIYMYRKLKDLINPYHEDVITRDVLLIFSTLGIMIYIALITIVFIIFLILLFLAVLDILIVMLLVDVLV